MTHALLGIIILILLIKFGFIQTFVEIISEQRKLILWGLFGAVVFIIALGNTQDDIAHAAKPVLTEDEKWNRHVRVMQGLGLTIPECARYITEEKVAREKGCIINLALQGDDPTLQYRALLEEK